MSWCAALPRRRRTILSCCRMPTRSCAPTRCANSLRAMPDAAEIACFELRHFNFYLNWETGERWLRSGPRAVRRKFFKRAASSARRARAVARA